MSISYEDKLALALPADGDEAWGNAARQNFEVLGELACPDNMYFVSPHFTDAYLHNAGASAPRHFSTIQAALNAVTTTGQNLTTIRVYPGLYQENLSITKSVHIIGDVPPLYRAASGNLFGGSAAICGTPGTQSPTITITPPESSYICVIINGVVLWNQYSATAGQIANAYLLKVAPQTTYGALANYIGLQDCDIRPQTYGLNNDWQHNMLVQGYNNLTMRRVAIASGSYAGGANNGGVNSILTLHGNNANGKVATARVLDWSPCELIYLGAYSSPAVFKLDNLANLLVAGCPLYRNAGAYGVLGATGTNSITGIGADLVNGTPATAAAYGNLLGIALAGM